MSRYLRTRGSGDFNREALIEADMHVNSLTGQNTKTNIKLLTEAHSKKLHLPMGYLAIGHWICSSYDNIAVHCVYDDLEDPCMDNCLYCGNPHERK